MNIGGMFGHRPDPRHYNESPFIVDSSVFVGIECELEHCRSPFRHDLWEAKEDGSLKENGIEYVTLPVRGDDIVHAVDVLSRTSDNKGVPSLRGSLHVHVDVRGLSKDEFKKFIVLCLIFEKTLYRYCGIEKENSIFCLPYYKTQGCVDILSAIFKYKNPPDRIVGSTIKYSKKYNGVNFKSVEKLGTVEFRMHKGTKDKEEILTWVNIILSIHKYARETDMSCEEFIAQSTALGQAAFLSEVFRDLSNVLMYDRHVLEADLLDGVRLAQDVVYAEQLQRPPKHRNEGEYGGYFKRYLKVNGYDVKNKNKRIKLADLDFDNIEQKVIAEAIENDDQENGIDW